MKRHVYVMDATEKAHGKTVKKIRHAEIGSENFTIEFDDGSVLEVYVRRHVEETQPILHFNYEDVEID